MWGNSYYLSQYRTHLFYTVIYWKVKICPGAFHVIVPINILECISLCDTRIKYHRNINSMKYLFNENISNVINYLKEVIIIFWCIMHSFSCLWFLVPL